jgi:prevent-host-death family protein
MAAARQSNIIGSYEAKTHFAELLDRAIDGEEITITRHGTPVAQLIPMKRRTTVEERREAIEGIRKLSQGLTLGGLKIKDLISEGRR